MGRAARLTGIVIVAAAAIGAAGYVLLPLVVRAFIRGLELTVNACVWFAANLSAGVDALTIPSTIGRDAGSALLAPQAFVAVCGLVLIGVLALYGLQRLLGSEDESSSR